MTTSEENTSTGCDIACSLPSEELTQRLAELMNGLLARLTQLSELPNGYALAFADSEDTRKEIDAFIAFEQQCCSFMTYTVTDDGAEHVTLALTGPEGTKAFLEKLIPSTGQASETDAAVPASGTALARTGLLDGRRATTNKMAFDWVAGHGPNVEWVKQARWVIDGKFATSSGVSAGIDMALDVISGLTDEETAQFLADIAEYEWHRDADWDPFAKLAGLV